LIDRFNNLGNSHPIVACARSASADIRVSHGLLGLYFVSRRRHEMYTGHARQFVCLSVCPRSHAHTTARTRM